MSIHVPDVFYKLCCHFFTEDGSKKQFQISNKSSVVSDPFVEYLNENVFIDGDIEHMMSPSHICPDLTFHKGDQNNLFGLEVKTSKSRSSDINFNSTVPCGNIIVKINGEEKIIPCYYLIVHLEENDESFEIGQMMFIDGNFINSDFELYLEATGTREKKINIGSYGDGMDKQRPMFMFPNPLRIAGIRAERSTLISKERFPSMSHEDKIGLVATLKRDNQDFFAYQAVRKLHVPFENINRSEKTKPRKKLNIKM